MAKYKWLEQSFAKTHFFYNKHEIRQKPNFYPDYELHVFYDKTVNINYLISIEDYCHLHYGDDKIPGYFWRFYLSDEITKDLILFRDIDSRFTQREVSAIEEWKSTDKKLHIMRDHPQHRYPIQGGMFGVKKSNINWKDKIKQKQYI